MSQSVKGAYVYDSSETVPLSRDAAELLAFVGLVSYSPGDGPNGIVYRPSEGVTIEQVKEALSE